MDKKKVVKYLIFALGLSWLIQIVVSVLSLKIGGNAGRYVFQGGLALCMFTPLDRKSVV